VLPDLMIQVKDEQHDINVFSSNSAARTRDPRKRPSGFVLFSLLCILVLTRYCCFSPNVWWEHLCYCYVYSADMIYVSQHLQRRLKWSRIDE
jgi:hypothetical protein